jgi:acyl-coenzyme A synthetase/AMP-(fatty) acid ligase
MKNFCIGMAVCFAFLPLAAQAQEKPTKITVALVVESENTELREATRSALASELRQLGDVTVGDIDSLGTNTGIALEAVAVGTLDRYSLYVEATPEPLILLLNAFYIGAHRNPSECIKVDDASAYLHRINDLLLAKQGGVLFMGTGRETLRKQCAAESTRH